MLYVEKYFAKNIPKDAIIIDTTSRSTNWSRGLSPFLLDGGILYKDYRAENVENAWQASKVYSIHIDKNGDPTPEYFRWADQIWKSKHAMRYPMGKGAIPEYSWWDGEKLNYIEARKKIYIPLYSRAVLTSDAFSTLLDLYRKEYRDIYLIDFDGYNHLKINKSMSEVINDPKMKMGHAFVIHLLLTKFINKPEIKTKKLF